MRKPTITKVWLGGIIAMVLGFVIVAVATGLGAAYGGIFTISSDGQTYTFASTQDAYFWSMSGLAIAGAVLAVAGWITQAVAWIGALVNSFHLHDKMWFVLNLILGLIGFGLVVMIAYVLAAPDGYEEQRRIAPTQAPVPPPAAAPTA